MVSRKMVAVKLGYRENIIAFSEKYDILLADDEIEVYYETENIMAGVLFFF